ncbi:MAG: FtsX-like permease family protein, partial [Oscillospiraceae bacterium]|nr:FtsX-like permease family protein [Oscillospiraceae bacterium]
TTSFKQNNLTEFKKYIEDPDSKIHKYIGENGVVYTYDTRFGIYTYDSEDALVNTDGSTLRTDNKYSFMNMMMRSMTMMTGTSSNFQELMPGTDGALISRTVTDNYEVIYGTMPDSYDDLVLVLDANNEIEATFLYQLGFLPTSEYKEIAKRIEDGDEVQEEQRRLDYAAICAQEFSLVPECDRYVKGDDGIYTLIDENSPEFDQLLQDAVKLHITAVIRPKEELDTMFITQPVGYTSALTDYLIDYTSRSEIVRAQEDDPDVNILNGLHFDADGSTDKLADVKNYIDGMGVSEKATLYQTILMLEQMREMGSDAQPETEATSETKSFEEALGSFSPLSEKPQASTRRSAAPRGAMAAHLGNFLGAGLHRLEAEIRTGITAQDPAPAGIAIADFRLMRAPDKTIYQLGEPLDLTGGIIHDSFVALNENGEPELIDNLQPLDFAEYTLQADAFDSTRPGIYPITVVKDYTDTNGEPAQESVVFYTMVIDPAMVAGTTDPTEPVTEPTELPTDETAPAESTDPTETTTETSPRFVFPTLPTDLTFPTLPTDLTLPTMPNVDFSDFFSDVLADALDKYMKKQTDNGTAFSGFSGMSPTDMAALYSQMMGGSGVSLPSGSANDLASLYAQMMGGSGASLPAGTSQNDLAALYAQMMGGSGAALPAGTSPNDMAALYAQMMGGGTGTTGTTMPSDMAALAAQMAGQTGLTQEQMADMYTKMYGNITPEDIEKMMAVAEMSEPELAEALDEYMKDPDEDILLEVYDRYIAAGSYDSNMTTFGVVSREAPSAINIYVDSFAAKEGISSCIKEYNETATEEDQISYTDYIGLLMSSVTTIVNAISYILIAFVAVSLIVSSIMIGIITYISVLERTKEIGILRAIGASKHNISQVFNAETFIIGLCSGLIGVGLSWLTLIPGNLLIHSLAKTDSINAILPIPAALILIAISIFLTLVGGFIPAKKASTKDPVTALRTE